MNEIRFMVSLFFLFCFCLVSVLLEFSFQPHHQLVQQHILNLPTKISNGDPRIGRGITINILHCSSLLYRVEALRMKDMLEDFFPGVHVKLDIQPPDFLRLQLVRGIRMGGVALIAVGIHIQLNVNLFLLKTYPFWNSLKSKTNWLERTEAFEVHFNGELIFSKLKEDRFPTEFELRELVARKVVDPTTADGLVAGVLWA